MPDRTTRRSFLGLSLALLLAALAAAPGCAAGQATPLKRWADAQDAYSATLTVLADYRRDGRIGPERAARIEALLETGQQALDALKAAAQPAAPNTSPAGGAARAEEFRRYVGVLNRVLDDLAAQKAAVEAGDPS